MLIVVHHRNVERLDQAVFDLEAARRANVFEVDAAEHRRDAHDRLNDLVDVFGVEADRKRVDVGELLEQHRLAFHHRQRAERPDVAETEHGGAVGDDRDRVALDGQLEGLARIRGDRHRNARDARRVDSRKVLAVFHGDLRIDANLAADVREERRVVCEDDARAVDRFDGAAQIVGDEVRRDADRHVADDAALRDRVHVDRADRPAGIADGVGEHAERPRLVRHVDA